VPSDTTITIKDASTNNVVMKARQFDDGTYAFYHVFDDRLPPGTNRSGTTLANSSKLVAVTNANRTKLTFQNVSDTVMYVSEDGTAASLTNGYRVPPSAFAEISTNLTCNVFCTVAGKAYNATEVLRV
jgi:hypothetical protein